MAHFLNFTGKIIHRENRLPHWQQAGKTYFCTWRLSDSLPQTLLQQWQLDREAWRSQNPPPLSRQQEDDYHQRFSAQIEAWLDLGFGSCVLRKNELRECLTDVFCKNEESRLEMLSYVIMPNHVHALFGLRGETRIGRAMQLLKGGSSHDAKSVGEGWPGWEKDYFDRCVRDEKHFNRCVRYIRKNPQRAKLRDGEFTLWESESTMHIGDLAQ
jgi:type I restriction enzyme R subunit